MVITCETPAEYNLYIIFKEAFSWLLREAVKIGRW